MGIKINCENLTRRKKVDLLKIKNLAARVLSLPGKPDIELNVVFVSAQKIRAINRRYLKRDEATDVITFDQHVLLASGKGEKDRRLFLGDIFISVDRAGRNAKEYGTTFEEETALYVVHGILHMMGYRDGTRKEKETMRRKENEILRKIRKTL